MESVLQLSEADDSEYPEYFKVFLSNCLEKFSDDFLPSDYLFAAVYFIILEYGFFPVDLYDKYPYSCTDSFDVRKLNFIKSYNSEHMKMVESQGSKYWVYGIPLRLGNYRCECELQGIPSAEDNNFLIINLIKKKSETVRSLCLNAENYVDIDYDYDDSDKGTYEIKGLKDLTLLIRDDMCKDIKDSIMLDEGQGCCPHLLRLPEDIQIKIIYSLIKMPLSVQYLSSTCSYFYNIISNDTKLWEKLCMTEFSGRAIYEALNDILNFTSKDECNLFRKVFFELKRRHMRRGYRFW